MPACSLTAEYLKGEEPPLRLPHIDIIGVMHKDFAHLGFPVTESRATTSRVLSLDSLSLNPVTKTVPRAKYGMELKVTSAIKGLPL